MIKKHIYKQFYQQCYLKNDGWVPMTPLSRKLNLGDFCQIHHLGLLPLGNITKLRLVQTIKSTDPIALSPESFQIEYGAEKVLGNTDTLPDDQEPPTDWNIHVLNFGQEGDFVFHGTKPQADFIANWSEFKSDITLKLTQTDYSFRDVYVITAVASVSRWGLAIAGAQDAQLELAAQTEGADYFASLSHPSAIAKQCQHMAVFEKSEGQPAYFFKAKKLILSDKKKEQIISQMMAQNESEASEELANWLTVDLLNRVKQNELNSNTCLDYFDWADLSLDDVEKICRI